MGIYNLSKGVNRFCLSKPGEWGRVDVPEGRDGQHRRGRGWPWASLCSGSVCIELSVVVMVSVLVFFSLFPLEGAVFSSKELEAESGRGSLSPGFVLGEDR